MIMWCEMVWLSTQNEIIHPGTHTALFFLISGLFFFFLLLLFFCIDWYHLTYLDLLIKHLVQCME